MLKYQNYFIIQIFWEIQSARSLYVMKGNPSYTKYYVEISLLEILVEDYEINCIFDNKTIDWQGLEVQPVFLIRDSSVLQQCIVVDPPPSLYVTFLE